MSDVKNRNGKKYKEVKSKGINAWLKNGFYLYKADLNSRQRNIEEP